MKETVLPQQTQVKFSVGPDRSTLPTKPDEVATFDTQFLNEAGIVPQSLHPDVAPSVDQEAGDERSMLGMSQEGSFSPVDILPSDVAATATWTPPYGWDD